MIDYEKLGAFYLGRPHDLKTGETSSTPLLYDSRDLVTHAVCVGMTGSGKTGLCIALLEEAAIDGIPAIVIDPKGDLANLLLTFPNLAPDEFRPWINEDDARRKNVEPDDYAMQQAELWKKGLASWDQDGARIRRLREAAEFAIYTPGSTAGIPVSVLQSFAAPSPVVRQDAEAFGDRVSSTATSVLGLAGIQTDPIRSREHILLSNIFSEAWKAGFDLDLGALISQVQMPPFRKVGVLDLESFYPAKDRFELVMALNNLAASPRFAAWLEGEELDVDQLLYTAAGKPRIAIFSIAHLDDAERMFFVSLLLNQTIAWMRTQSGTTSLRALLYMDEIFGYLPPVANPPSKLPLLTLLKQARAYGLGLVLATQNPVDLDYKALSNIGTWFIGRVQTERDKARLLEGLEGAAAGTGAKFDRGAMEQSLAGLGNRIFLMNNVHEDSPEIFETRWVMSYLRGPLTRNQIRKLVEDQPGFSAAAPETSVDAGTPPILPPEIKQYYLPVRNRFAPNAAPVYVARVIGIADVHIRDKNREIEADETLAFLASIETGPEPVDWEKAEPLQIDSDELENEPEPDIRNYLDPPPEATQEKNYVRWSKDFITWVYRTHTLELLKSPSLDLFSRPGECERDFRIRLQLSGREQRDAVIEALRAKYASKEATLERRLHAAKQRVAREAEQARDRKFQTAISLGSTILGALMGRKRLSISSVSRATAAARSASRILKEQQDVERAEDSVEKVEAELKALSDRCEEEIAALTSKMDPVTEGLESVTLRPLKREVEVRVLALVWVAEDRR
jgi:hypothetical protein